jgi:hypothetical protein
LLWRGPSAIPHAAKTAVLGGTAVYAQDNYSLKSPSGIAFSDFRGYEDWSVVSSARTDEVLKVIVANPTMIKAYKAGVPGNSKSFPDGSMIVKLQWKPKKSTEAPFAVDVPDVFTQAFVMEKDSKRFPKSGGWGYALFNYEAASDKFSRSQPLRLRTRVSCGREGEGLHLPPVPEALNRARPRQLLRGALPAFTGGGRFLSRRRSPSCSATMVARQGCVNTTIALFRPSRETQCVLAWEQLRRQNLNRPMCGQ